MVGVQLFRKIINSLSFTAKQGFAFGAFITYIKIIQKNVPIFFLNSISKISSIYFSYCNKIKILRILETF